MPARRGRAVPTCLGAEVDLKARRVHGRVLGEEVEFARHAPHMTRDLESRVREFERPPAIAAAGVLGADQFLEDIEVSALQARAQSEADVLRKLPNLGDDPAQDVAGQNHGSRCFQTGFSGASATRWEGFGTVLLAMALCVPKRRRKGEGWRKEGKEERKLKGPSRRGTRG